MKAPNHESLNVAVVQLTSTNRVEDNKSRVLQILNSIQEPVHFISLPENTFFIRIQESDPVEYIELESDFWEPFKNFCKTKNCFLHIGATPLRIKRQRFNSTVLISPQGDVSAPYQKLHLFDIQLENKKPISESDIFDYGSKPSIIDIFGWKVGLTICYDLRFSELFFYYQSQHVDLILTPSAFLVETGKLHWDILQRARAIESQCYIIAAAQGGHHGSSKHTYGHSMIVSPWGVKLQEILDASQESYACMQIHKSEIQKMRKQIPMSSHRRLKLIFE